MFCAVRKSGGVISAPFHGCKGNWFYTARALHFAHMFDSEQMCVLRTYSGGFICTSST